MTFSQKNVESFLGLSLHCKIILVSVTIDLLNQSRLCVSPGSLSIVHIAIQKHLNM